MEKALKPDQKEREPMQEMFGGIAGRYELVNSLMSLFQDEGWRRHGVNLLAAKPGHLILDVGTGTGNLAREVLRQIPGARVVACDLTHEMMRYGVDRSPADQVSWVVCDAQALPFAGLSFNGVISGFLFRNLPNVMLGLSEQFRILKPGSRFVTIDTTPPRNNILKPFILFYIKAIIPLIGQLVTGNGKAYAYLSESTRTYISAEKLAGFMKEAGFVSVDFIRKTFGAAAIHSGRKP